METVLPPDAESPQEPTQPSPTEPSLPKRRGRDEALTWPIGAAFLSVLLITFGAGVWWVSLNADRRSQDAALHRAESLANQLSVTAEPLLAAGELSAVRRLLSETALQNQLTTCQLTLSDGRAIADADLSQPQMTVLPADWPADGVSSEPQSRVIAGQALVSRPVPVPGRGDAEVQIAMDLPKSTAMLGPALPGVGVIGGIGLIGMLVVYRKLRTRLGVLTMIRGALCDAGDGAALDGLRLDPRWSHEAAGWNRVLDRQDAQAQAQLDEQLDSMGQRVGSGGALEAGCDGLGQGLAVIDAMGHVAYANGAACAALGWTREDAVGSPLDQVVIDDGLRDAVHLAYTGQGPARATLECDRDAGETKNVLRHTVRPIGSGETTGALLLIEDITQQRVAESSRHDFVAKVTHELRTPLTNIRMYLETAQDDGPDDVDVMTECLNVIGRESQRLERLVGEMLSVSEIEAGAIALKRDDIRLDALFKQIESDFGALAVEQQVELTFDLPPKLPVVQGDRDKFAVVLQNLLGNAIKYSPDGGEVRVHVDAGQGALNIEVSDTGIGISEEDQQRVFDKFTRANDARIGEITGSGLGLALAREIVRLHGGDITLESELNQGSTFRIHLPITGEGA